MGLIHQNGPGGPECIWAILGYTVEDTVVEPNGTGGKWTKHVTALGLQGNP